MIRSIWYAETRTNISLNPYLWSYNDTKVIQIKIRDQHSNEITVQSLTQEFNILFIILILFCIILLRENARIIYNLIRNVIGVNIYTFLLCNFLSIKNGKSETKGTQKIIVQLLSAFVATNRPVDFNPYVRAENRRPTDGRRFIYWRKDFGAGSRSSSRSLDASSVLSRIQFGHCPRFYLQRGITIAFVYGWTVLDVRGTGRRPLALILYRTLYPRSLPRPASSSPQLPPSPSSTSSTLGRAGIFNSFEYGGRKAVCSGRVVLPCYWPVSGSWNQ